MGIYREKFFLLLLLLMFAAVINLGAMVVPEQDSGVNYFYVFGPHGDPEWGAASAQEMDLYVEVPENYPGDVFISVYDPDTGGFRDTNGNRGEFWDTVTDFTVLGANDRELAKQSFGSEKTYDKKYYVFGPFAKTQGNKTGAGYQFKLKASVTEGSDENLFAVKVFPDSTQVFSYQINFRLLDPQGSKMYFYPEVSAGTRSIVVENYDLDFDGGTAMVSIPSSGMKYAVAQSLSTEWGSTEIPVNAEASERVQYIITKLTQKYANAAVRVKDDKGNPVPIYFRKGAPVARVISSPPLQKEESKCNRYTFDATKSYDPNNEKLSYAWDFGDGTASDKPVVTHVFEKGGEYTVKLTVKDTSGMECDTAQTSEIVKVNTPPVASFTAPANACAGQDVVLDAGGTTDDTPDTLSYEWDLGDGARAEGRTVNKSYSKGGKYNVKLFVNDNAGTSCSTSADQKVIHINTSPEVTVGEDVYQCVRIGEEFEVVLKADGRDPDGDSLRYTWDFGGGETTEGRTVTHVYKKAGAYTARVTVDDGGNLSCSSASKTVNINLNRQPIADAGVDNAICAGSEVVFDGSGSQVEEGSNPSFVWDFGDGSAKEKGVKAAHTYKKGGNYQATLTVDDGNGTSCSIDSDTSVVNVNAKPQAQLAAVETVCTGKTVYFDASGSNDPDGGALIYHWDFGDGTTGAGPVKISHEYEKGGRYTAVVTVDDGRGSACNPVCSRDSKAVEVRVNTPPKANAGPNLVCCAGWENFFDGSTSTDADEDVLSYTWDFGDGTTATGAKVTHVYPQSGRYKVVLAVNDNSGTPCSSSSSSFEASVNERPVPVIKIK
ncbi:MAG: PKD domain-containing protein [Candidatus Omnitrophota bacterium]|jgi:PKD repeat protein